MATVQSVLDSCRYDLDDYEAGIVWDDTELLNYINRMVDYMTSELAALNSELVEAEETDIDCVADQNYVDLSGMNSGNWTNIKRVWIGQDLLEQASVANIRYKRMFRASDTAEPQYWALQNQRLLFEVDCASAYTDLTITYNIQQPALTLTDSMPYQDRFNNAFREILTLYAEARKEGQVSSVNSTMNALFKKRAAEEVIRRNFVERAYHIDF